MYFDEIDFFKKQKRNRFKGLLSGVAVAALIAVIAYYYCYDDLFYTHEECLRTAWIAFSIVIGLWVIVAIFVVITRDIPLRRLDSYQVEEIRKVLPPNINKRFTQEDSSRDYNQYTIQDVYINNQNTDVYVTKEYIIVDEKLSIRLIPIEGIVAISNRNTLMKSLKQTKQKQVNANSKITIKYQHKKDQYIVVNNGYPKFNYTNFKNALTYFVKGKITFLEY